MEDAATSFKTAGTQVIISSQTPPNPFRTGTTPVYALYAKAVAEKTGATFVDHLSLTRDEYMGLGAVAVDKMLPSDGIHTTLAGAKVAAGSFIRGVLCAGQANPLYPYVTMKARLVSSFCVLNGDILLTPPVALVGNLEAKGRCGLQRGIIVQPLSTSECAFHLHLCFFVGLSLKWTCYIPQCIQCNNAKRTFVDNGAGKLVHRNHHFHSLTEKGSYKSRVNSS